MLPKSKKNLDDTTEVKRPKALIGPKSKQTATLMKPQLLYREGLSNGIRADSTETYDRIQDNNK